MFFYYIYVCKIVTIDVSNLPYIDGSQYTVSPQYPLLLLKRYITILTVRVKYYLKQFKSMEFHTPLSFTSNYIFTFN